MDSIRRLRRPRIVARAFRRIFGGAAPAQPLLAGVPAMAAEQDVPIRTSPHVKFRIDGEEVHFSAGDTWYLNASCLHGVENRGPAARVHLMIDCVTNEWLERAFQEAGGILREPPPYGDGAINDGNVLDVVASLRAGGHAVAARLADELEAIHARRTSTDTLSPG